MRLITRLEHITESQDEQFDRPSRRRLLRTRRYPAQQLEFRERKASDRPLPDMELIEGGTLKGEDRCGVIGLPAGPCRQRRRGTSAYCFYHDKLQKGLTTPTAETYPVWPLPEKGYVFLQEVPREWVA